MATKDEIINNLREYSASDIVHAIKCGEITMYELSKSGKLTPLMKKRIEEQMSSELVAEVPLQPSTELDQNPVEADVQQNSEIAVEVMTDNGSNDITETIPPTLPPNIIPQNSEVASEIIDNKGMFKRIFSFKGRIRRTELGLSYIIFCVWYVIIMSVTEMRDPNPVLALFIILSIVPAYWFLWAQGAKRCHDRGNSGWYQIIPFYFLVMLFGGSEAGINDYGTNPKE